MRAARSSLIMPARSRALARVAAIAAGASALMLGSGCVAVAVAQQPAAQPLTLEAALQYSHAHSPRLAAARQGVITGAATVAAAHARRWPRLDVGAAYRGAGRPTQTAVGFPPLTGLSDIPGGQPFSREHLNAAAYLTMPVYEGGQISAGTRLAEAQRHVATIQEADVERSLDFDIVRAYAQLVEFEQDARAADESHEALEESRRVIAQMVDVGKAPRVDLLKVDTRLADVRARVISYDNAARIQAGQLNALLGRPIQAAIVPQDTLSRPVIGLTVDQVIQAALRSNTAYQLAAARIQVAHQEVDVARAQLRPSVSLGVGYEMQSADPLSQRYGTMPVAGIVISAPLYDRALTRRVDVAHSQEQERRLDLEQRRLDIEQRAQTAFLQVQDASERIQATEAAIASAGEALRIEQNIERLGRGTIEHLLDAQAAQFRADADYARARADYVIAVAALERETGISFIRSEQLQ